MDPMGSKHPAYLLSPVLYLPCHSHQRDQHIGNVAGIPKLAGN